MYTLIEVRAIRRVYTFLYATQKHKLFGFYSNYCLNLQIWRAASGIWRAQSRPGCVELTFCHSRACLRVTGGKHKLSLFTSCGGYLSHLFQVANSSSRNLAVLSRLDVVNIGIQLVFSRPSTFFRPPYTIFYYTVQIRTRMHFNVHVFETRFR